MKTTSFRLRLLLFSVIISGTVLGLFTMVIWTAVHRINLKRIDQNLAAMAERHMAQRQLPHHLRQLDHAAEYMMGAEGEVPRVTLVVNWQDEVLFKSDNWPKELSRQDIIPADRAKPPENVGLTTLPPPARKSGPKHEQFPRPSPHLPPSRHLTSPTFRTVVVNHHRRRFVMVSDAKATLAMGMSMNDLEGDIRHLRRILLSAFAVALLLITAGGWWLANRALHPVLLLTNTANQISAGNLSDRISETGADAEFQRLIHVFNEMLARLQKSFQQATRFSADAAHELKTPLTVLQGELEQAVQDAACGSAEQQQFVRLLDETQRLASIVRKLLLLSRADSGKLNIDHQPFNFSNMVSAMIEDMDVLAPTLEIRSSVAPDLQISGDPELLQQAIQNLSTNAIRYNCDNGFIDFNLSSNGESVILRITNSGPEIPMAKRAHIFDRFYRVSESRDRNIDGLGLGLSLAHEIVRAHQGTLVLEASNSDGTTFILELPGSENRLS